MPTKLRETRAKCTFAYSKEMEESASPPSKAWLTTSTSNAFVKRRCYLLAHAHVTFPFAHSFKKNFQCNGAVTKDAELGEIIQLSGDQRTNVSDFLCDQEICTKSQVVIHGF